MFKNKHLRLLCNAIMIFIIFSFVCCDSCKLEDIYEYGNFAVFDMFPQTKHTETVMEFKLK